MTWDAVPWFVGGGAQHSPEVARLLAYAATGGAEGIVSPGDLKVTATTVPGGSVDIAPGDCLIRHRGQGGDSQTYAARNHTRDNVSIAATGPTARSDLIVAQIEDPFIAGEPWQEPEDVTAGPYVFTRVIPNVPPWTTRLQDVTGFEGRTAIVLARVDVPPNTGTITHDLITDLRQLARPRLQTDIQMNVPTHGATLTTRTPWTVWPEYSPRFYIPEWATRIDVVCHVNGIIVSDWTYSTHMLRVGTAAPTSAYPGANTDSMICGGATILDHDCIQTPLYTGETLNLVVGLGEPIPEAMRGTTQPIELLSFRGGLDAGHDIDPGTLWTSASTHMVFDVRFSERTV